MSDLTGVSDTVALADGISVKIPIRDEFVGTITVTYEFTTEDAAKVVGLAPSVARLYFGHDVGPHLQFALKKWHEHETD